MPKPILLSVDDDSDVLRAIERDLRSQYGAEYRVIGSDSPEGALDLLKQLKVRNDSVALLLADQRMPRMDGVEFLQQAMGIYPTGKLLTIRHFKGSGYWARDGLLARTNCETSWREITSHINGLTLRLLRMI